MAVVYHRQERSIDKPASSSFYFLPCFRLKCDRFYFMQFCKQARPYLTILLRCVANAPDFVLSEQEIWVTWCEFRDCPFNGPTIEFVDFKRVHAIEGQSNSPIGEVSVAATCRPRLDCRVVAWSLTLTSTRSVPSAAQSQPG